MSYGEVVLGKALLVSWMLVFEKRRHGSPRGMCNSFYASTLGNWVLRYLVKYHSGCVCEGVFR